MLDYRYDDGGRADAGFKGVCGDCGTRAAAIALSLPYKEVYDELNSIRKELLAKTRSANMKRLLSGSVRDGTAVEVMKEFMNRHGWVWVATMSIGSGCTKHLDDMPHNGAYVCRVAKHYCAVVNGQIRDIFQDSGDRCVYGYWRKRTNFERREAYTERWYITATDDKGEILAWVEGSKFVSTTSAVFIPKSFLSREDAVKALKELGKDGVWQVRKARITTRWSEPM